MQNYAEVLESYLIPVEEGFANVAKGIISKIRKTIEWLLEQFKKLLVKIKRVKSENSQPVDNTLTDPKFHGKFMDGYKKFSSGVREIDTQYMKKLNLKTTYEEIPESAENAFEILSEGSEILRELHKTDSGQYLAELDAINSTEVTKVVEDVASVATFILDTVLLKVMRELELANNQEKITVVNHHVTMLSKILSALSIWTN